MLLQTQYWLLFKLSSSWLSNRSLLCASPLTVRSSFSVMILSFLPSSPPPPFFPSSSSSFLSLLCLLLSFYCCCWVVASRQKRQRRDTVHIVEKLVQWSSDLPLAPSAPPKVDYERRSTMQNYDYNYIPNITCQQVCVIFSNSRNVRKMALLLMSSSRLWWW